MAALEQSVFLSAEAAVNAAAKEPRAFATDLRFLLQFVVQHPASQNPNRRWPVNPWRMLRLAGRVLPELASRGDRPASFSFAFVPPPRPVLWTPATAIRTHNLWRPQLQRDLRRWSGLSYHQDETPTQFMRRAAVALTVIQGKRRARLGRAFVRCLPLYLKGTDAAQTLAGLEDRELWELYHDGWSTLGRALQPRRGERPFAELFTAWLTAGGQLRRLFGRDFNPRADLYPSKTTVNLLGATPTAALLRGLVADDCASERVPFYALCPGVNTYWLYVSRGDPTVPTSPTLSSLSTLSTLSGTGVSAAFSTSKRLPKVVGYVMTVDVACGGMRMPMLLTVASEYFATHPSALQPLVAALAQQAGSSGVCVPNLLDPTNLELCNFPKISSALMGMAQASAETIALPSSWATIDACTRDHIASVHGNCYQSRPALQQVFSIPCSTENAPPLAVTVASSQRETPVPIISFHIRARLAADIYDELRATAAPTPDYKELAEELAMSDQEVALSWQFFYDSRKHGLSCQKFVRIQEALAITLRDLLVLPPVVATRSLQDIFRQRPLLATTQHWLELFHQPRQAFDRQLATRDRLPPERYQQTVGEAIWTLLCLEAYTPIAFRRQILAAGDLANLAQKPWFWRHTFGAYLGWLLALIARWRHGKLLPWGMMRFLAIFRLKLARRTIVR